MARLCRFVKLGDRHDAQVFTFVVPGRLTREFTPDSYSQDFVYGHQRWQVTFQRSDRHIGVFLRLQTTSPDTVVRADFACTVMNREHFTRNEVFLEKACEFSVDNPSYGRKTLIEIDDLMHRQFIQESGDILMELEIRNCSSVYEAYLHLPKEAHHARGQGHGPVLGPDERLESSYFSFGLFDWSLSLAQDVSSAEADGGGVTVQIVRHTHFDHLCRVHFRVTVGDEDTINSGEITQLLDSTGWGEPFPLGITLHRLFRHWSKAKVRVEMLNVVSVSEMSIAAMSHSQRCCHCYDRDKQAWTLEADVSGKFLLFKLYYADISHVPRNFLRYVSWHLRVMTRKSGRSVKATDGPFSRYYVQQDIDDGVNMRTDIQVDELSDPNSPYLDLKDRKLTVYLEWLDSHLLVWPHYNNLDDVTRLHKQQMWREVLTLQAENYALERQLYSYQQTIAQKDARGHYEMEPLSRQSSLNS